MIAFLKSSAVKAPPTITSAKLPDAKEAGYLIPSFDRGSVLLEDASHRAWRLSWEENSNAKRRALPPGHYSLQNYRVIRRDSKGSEWYLSGIPQHAPRITVRAGVEQRLEIDDTINVPCQTKPHEGGWLIMAPISGANHSGITIYKDGKRIPLRYRISDAAGNEIASGAMNYG